MMLKGNQDIDQEYLDAVLEDPGSLSGSCEVENMFSRIKADECMLPSTIKSNRYYNFGASGCVCLCVCVCSDPLSHVFYLEGSGAHGSSRTASRSSMSISGLSKTSVS